MAARSAMFLRHGSLVTLTLFLSWANCGWGLNPSRAPNEYSLRTWTRQNGLPVNGIQAIAQASDGYIYLGTAGGLTRFDGRVFESIDLTREAMVRTTVVRELRVGQNGGLWVGLENSAFGFFDGREFSFRGKEEYGGLAMNIRNIRASRNGDLLLVAQHGAARLSPTGEYTRMLTWSEDRKINILFGFEDAQGRCWLSTADDNLYCWSSGNIKQFTEIGTDDVLSMTQESDGTLWFGTTKGLKCYTADLKPKPIPPLIGSVRVLLDDEHGTLWIGTDLNGLFAYRKGEYIHFGKELGLPSEKITALMEDREGSLWVGTDQGLSQMMDVKFRTLAAVENSPGDYVSAVAASRRGGVWIGSEAGVTYYDGNRKTYAAESGLPKEGIKRIYEASNGDLYMVSGLRSLVVLSEGRMVARHTMPTLVVGLAEDSQGMIASVGGELYRASKEAMVPYAFVGPKPKFIWILNLLIAKDGALLVASEAGLFRIKDGVVRQWNSSDGLIDERVQGICEDQDGVIWVSLFSGIGRLKDNKICNIGRKDGLFDNNVYAVVPDDFGNLWVDSGKGIFRVSRQMMNDFADGKINRVECLAYDSLDSGVTADKTSTQEHVGCRSIDGRIWFPGARGMVMIEPANTLTNQVPPQVHIERAAANRRPVVTGQHRIPPGEGELEFHFTALTFITPEKAQFRYQLEGFDDGWVEAHNRRIAYYTNLKPGKYTFRVTAANSDGVWNDRGDSIELELLPHFYQTVWFYVLVGAAGVGTLGALYYWRTQQFYLKQRMLQENRDRLEKEVQSRTAELAKVNLSLQREVEDRKRTAVELVERTKALENEIQERIQMQRQIEQIHRSLLDASRQAGMAEIATNVLHNVGNVLNSVNVSSALALDGMRKLSIPSLERIVALLREHQNDLGSFLNTDPRGAKVLPYLAQLSAHFSTEQATMLKELQALRDNIEHIREIVVMQQSFATASGLKEVIDMKDLIEDSLKINSSAIDRHGVQVTRDFQPVPKIEVDKHKILQILVNLVSNAKHACNQARRIDKRITIRLYHQNNRLFVSVIDNGMGVSPENLTRIFNHGFTTRKDGHGFGLHSGAIAATEMGGSLTVTSDGVGQGATFTLELPCPERPVNRVPPQYSSVG